MPKLRCIFNGVGIMIAQKARRLIELEAFGIRVPRFAAFTVPCSEDGEISLLKSLYHDRVSEVVATCKEYVIIRPCLQQEDDVKASYAGILDSPIFHKTCIDADGFARIVSSVNGDILNNKRIAEYCKKNKIPFSPPSEVSYIVQHFVEGESSGIMFTQNPVNRRDEIVIESTIGLNCALTDGIVSPDMYVINKNDLDKYEATLGSKKRFAAISDHEIVIESRSNETNRLSLTERQIKELALIGIRLQKVYNAPQDIEWTYSGNKLYILQTRPIVL